MFRVTLCDAAELQLVEAVNLPRIDWSTKEVGGGGEGVFNGRQKQKA